METLGIGQLAKRGGVGIDTVRYYERNGLLAPRTRLASGYRRYGELEPDGPWLVIGAAGEEDLPAIVEIAVQAGARVYGVELLHPTLEDRFRQLLESA